MQRERVLSVRLTEGELKALNTMAERRGMPLSVFVRETALALTRPYRGWSQNPPTTNGSGTVLPVRHDG